MVETVRRLLAHGADDAAAIDAPQRTALTYARLRRHVERTVATLNQLGIGRGDRVAIVLPNGPEMAAAFVAISAGATTAPLNPSYRAQEFEFYLSDLRASALIVETGADSAAVPVAERLDIPIIRLAPYPLEPAGLFELLGTEAALCGSGGYAEPGDAALMLHTSGTTSRPKIVPLSHRNICASAANIARTLRLDKSDRCLNVMPLFHIHGLIAAVLASLAAGSSVFCTPGFNALRFFGWINASRPTWYTAAPTMHQAILSRADRNRDVIALRPLRLIRSSSAPLPSRIMAALEDVFDAPVIESYGMTEAAHQMASNPLPPALRKAGSVGIAAGPEIAIMDEVGDLVLAGEVGEVVIRGVNVTAGYENNPAANAMTFTSGWMRTGDQGVMDREGYLTITGRLKEIIIRGGEKIAPREIDEVLLDHPAVVQAMTYGVPHDKLGEDVAAAIVLADGANASESEIQEFAAERLAEFKVPGRVIFIDEIPKSATGKLQRTGWDGGRPDLRRGWGARRLRARIRIDVRRTDGGFGGCEVRTDGSTVTMRGGIRSSSATLTDCRADDR